MFLILAVENMWQQPTVTKVAFEKKGGQHCTNVELGRKERQEEIIPGRET